MRSDALQGGERAVQWFRWWHDATVDGKLLRLSYQHRWLWIALLTLASQSPKRGSLYVSSELPCDINDVSREANMPPNICRAGIDLMMRPQFRMLDTDENDAWRIVNWDKRQPKRDDSSQYVKTHRAKGARNAQCNADVMPPETETDTDHNNARIAPSAKGDYPVEFEAFWASYPRRLNKKGAFAKWKSSLKKPGASAEVLNKSSEAYAAECKRKGTEENYIMHAATFLGPQERWRDYTNTPQSQPVKKAEPEFRTPKEPEIARLRRELRERGEIE